MATKGHSATNPQLTVSFDAGKCAHAGHCFGELKSVFDGDRDPPIDLDGAPLEEIIRVVEMCPSSALTYERHDGGEAESADARAGATARRGGPMAVRGDLQIGEQRYTRLTFCRCGQSANKPFCDGSHHGHDFDDGIQAARESVEGEAPAGAVTFKPIPNGPLFHDGPLTYYDADGKVICRRDRAAICRCGGSANKPFCDGSHKHNGFTDA